MAEMVTLLKGHCENMVLEGVDHPTAFENYCHLLFYNPIFFPCDIRNRIPQKLHMVPANGCKDHQQRIGDNQLLEGQV